ACRTRLRQRMQNSLFDDFEDADEPAPVAAPVPAPAPKKRTAARTTRVLPLPPDPALQALAGELPPTLRLGTSSWYFPGWTGMVWEGEYEQSVLSKHGLAAYAQHPLSRAVSIDRSFYKPLTATQFAAYAAQVPEDFRFTVKAPSLVADAMVRA